MIHGHTAPSCVSANPISPMIMSNYPDDTQGCILVGENRQKGMVVNSRIWLHRLKKCIGEARGKGE